MNNTIKILVVEDEYITQKIICNYLEELGYHVAGTAMSYDEALEILTTTTTIDLALLDITIKGDKTGVDIANYINENTKIPHIFLTAYSDSETISKAVKTNPYGYIIKPFEKINIYSAIELAITNFNAKNSIEKNDTYFFLKVNEIYTKLFYKDIDFIESQRNYLLITIADKIFKQRLTLAEFLKKAPDYFIQIHKGFIVNSNNVKGISSTHVFVQNHKIPFSKMFKSVIESKIIK